MSRLRTVLTVIEYSVRVLCVRSNNEMDLSAGDGRFVS